MKRAHLMCLCTLCRGLHPSIWMLFCTDRFCSSKVSQGQIIDESCVNLLVLYRVEECMKAKQDHFTEVENLKSTGDYHFCHRSCSRAFLRLEANQHLPNLTEAMKRTAGWGWMLSAACCKVATWHLIGFDVCLSVSHLIPVLAAMRCNETLQCANGMGMQHACTSPCVVPGTATIAIGCIPGASTLPGGCTVWDVHCGDIARGGRLGRLGRSMSKPFFHWGNLRYRRIVQFCLVKIPAWYHAHAFSMCCRTGWPHPTLALR